MLQTENILSSKPYNNHGINGNVVSRYYDTQNFSSVQLSWDLISRYHDNVVILPNPTLYIRIHLPT